MSDFIETVETVEQTTTAGTEPETPNARHLREAAERGEQARKEADDLKRENVFLKAGVDMESDVGKLLFDGYKGDLDVEAVKAKAAAVGALYAPPVADTEATPTPEELQQTAERMELAGDSTPPGSQPAPDPRQEGLSAFHQAVANGAKREDAAAEFINRVVDGAVKGDERVLYDPERDRVGR